MKKTRFIVYLLVMLILYLFPLKSFCNNTTEVRINVHEINVNCDKNGSFIVNENTYNDKKSFFVAEDATISITVISKKGYVVDCIECDTECNSNFENDKLVIRNITDNINVKIIFKPTGNSVLGDELEVDENIKNENQEILICVWCIIFLICILITIFYLIYKRKNKN